MLASALPRASTLLASLGQAAFVWDIATDGMIWSDHAKALFSDIPPASLRSGAAFAKLIEPERSIRTDALNQSPPPQRGGSAPYRIEYGVRASTAAPVLLIEGTGCWVAGPDGKTARAQGIVRITNARPGRGR